MLANLLRSALTSLGLVLLLVTPTAGAMPSRAGGYSSAPRMPGDMPAQPQSNPAIITPQNAAALQLADQDQYPPWDLVHAVAWAPDSQQFAVSAGENLLFYQPPQLRPTFVQPLGVWSPGLAYHPTRAWLAVGGRNGILSLFELNRHLSLWQVNAHPRGITRLAISPDGGWIASGGYEPYARVWDMLSGESQSAMIGGTYAIPALAITPDGQRVVMANGDIIRLREVASGRISLSLYARDAVTALAVSADGAVLVSGSANGLLELWALPGDTGGSPTLDSSTLLPNPAGRSARSLDRLVWELALNPQGNLLAVAQGTGQVQLWDLETLELRASLAGHPGGVTCVTFSPDGRYLLSGGLDAAVRLWQASP